MRVMGHYERVIARRRAKRRVQARIQEETLRVFRVTRRHVVASVRRLKKDDPIDNWLSDMETQFNEAIDAAFAWGVVELGDIERRYYADHGIDVTYDPQYVLQAHAIGTKIKNIVETTRQSVEDLIRNWYNTDQSTDELIDGLDGVFGETRAERIAITETAILSSTVTDEMMNAAGIDQWDWVTSGQDNVCDYCLSMAAGGPYTRRDPMPPGPGHPVGCFCDAAPRLPELE